MKNKFKINISVKNFDFSIYDIGLVISQAILIFLHFIEINLISYKLFYVESKFFIYLSKILVISGIILLLISIKYLKNSLSPFPKPKNNKGFISSGIYRIIKHPMYYSIIIISIGLFFKNPSLYNLSLSLSLGLVLLLKIRQEEKYLINTFPDYLAYKNNLKF
tara:strand:+ start:6490 stop:6978 length:489 start_codon:yes stop_codon:yes gene_type:complete